MMKIKILEEISPVVRKDKYSNRYCGPAALSIITGIDTKETSKMIREANDKHFVCGISDTEMRITLAYMGVRFTFNSVNRQTLKAWLDNTEFSRKNAIHILIYRNHYAVIQGNKYCCAQSKDIIDINDKHEAIKMRGIVKAIIRIKPKGERWKL